MQELVGWAANFKVLLAGKAEAKETQLAAGLLFVEEASSTRIRSVIWWMLDFSVYWMAR